MKSKKRIKKSRETAATKSMVVTKESIFDRLTFSDIFIAFGTRPCQLLEYWKLRQLILNWK
jgi:hypothetical protein